MEELPEHWPSVEEYTATCSIVRKNMAMADRDNTDSSADKRSLRDLFGGLLFYVGIPATTLYPLQFLALSVQL